MPQDIAVELDDRLIEALEYMARRRSVSLDDLIRRLVEDAARTECPSTATENAPTS